MKRARFPYDLLPKSTLPEGKSGDWKWAVAIQWASAAPSVES